MMLRAWGIQFALIVCFYMLEQISNKGNGRRLVRHIAAAISDEW